MFTRETKLFLSGLEEQLRKRSEECYDSAQFSEDKEYAAELNKMADRIRTLTFDASVITASCVYDPVERERLIEELRDSNDDALGASRYAAYDEGVQSVVSWNNAVLERLGYDLYK
jgi:hypothetical protein